MLSEEIYGVEVTLLFGCLVGQIYASNRIQSRWFQSFMDMLMIKLRGDEIIEIICTIHFTIFLSYRILSKRYEE